MTLPAYAIPREDELKLSGERDKIAYLRHDGTMLTPMVKRNRVLSPMYIEWRRK